MIGIMLLIITSHSTGGEVAAASKFKDIDENYREYIEYLYNKKIINGINETEFGSKKTITREDAAKMIASAKGLPGVTPTKTKFPDVDPKSYASGYIKAAADKGYITGYPDGTFRPKQQITRGEMAYLITKAFGFTKTSTVFYKDVPTGTAQYDVINKLTTAGITNGTSGGNYSPKAAMPREQFAAFVARSLNSAFRVEYKMAAIDTKYVTASSLNVRHDPSTNKAPKGIFKQNEKVQVYGIIGNWAYVSNGKLEGYVSMSYLANSQVSTTPSKGKRVITIDAGHGAHDPGAQANGIREKDLNLDVSLRVEKYLKSKGITVHMTRKTDVFLTLQQRVNVAKSNGSNAFVSIHGNAASASASGTETFYYASVQSRAQDSKQLATFIQSRLYKALGTTNRGVKNGNLHVLRENPLPAALVELGFLTNASDAKKLSSNTYKDLAAKAIADGIEDYYKWKEKQ